MCSVLGIGVAVIVKTSIFVLNFFIFSLSLTPKRCSSSIIKRPKSLKLTSSLSSLCVPTTTSTSPNLSFFIISSCSFLVLNLFNNSTFIANSCILVLNSSYCWFASIVVGTKYATCFWSITALNAALIATSVLPYPTSPHKSLSIGCGFSISFFTSCIHLNWSSVSVYGKLSSNCFCQGVSGEKLNPFIFWRLAYSSIKSFATASKFFFTLLVVALHSFPPSLFSLGDELSPPPIYFLTLSKLFVGTYRMSSFLYLILI